MRAILVTCGLLLAACGPSATGGGDDNVGDGTGEACEGSETSCRGNEYWTCNGDEFVVADTCDAGETCDAQAGCQMVDTSCTSGTNTCVGNQIYTCENGEPGTLVENCAFGCLSGMCTDEGGNTGEGCADGASEFVYVVDDANMLYKFDPANDAHTFELIGTLSCPAGPSLAGGPASPFSMSVDRDAKAWVLYSSGEVFHVSTENASCTATSFPTRQMNYDVFGMGFVAESAGSSSEKLFVAGANFDPVDGSLIDPKLGWVDKASMQLTHLQNLTNVENPPELTGTGDAKLYGYFPGAQSVIAELDKTTGSRVPGQQWPAGSSVNLGAWAFAQWGGRFYVFVTDGALFQTSKVIRVDPAANGGQGAFETVSELGVPRIVGAGVSTCAPVVVD